MSEVEKHYAVGHPPAGDQHQGAEPAGQGRVDAAVAAAGKASSRVKEAVGEAVGRASTWSQDRYGGAADWASETYEDATRRATYARRKTAVHAGRGWRSVEHFVDENPVMVGVVGLAAGLLAGALIPGTRRENQYFGRYADEVRDQGLRYVQDVAEQGRHMVEENLGRLRPDPGASR